VVALERDVGIDVEHIERRVDIDQLARSVFSDAERTALARLAEERRRLRFFELWTLKEAYIKAVGKGLALPLQAITLELDSVRAPRITFDARLEDSSDAWWLEARRLGEAHMLAVAFKRGDPSPIAVQEWVPQGR
jgi:4'-phosphopantetheinyl transferase